MLLKRYLLAFLLPAALAWAQPYSGYDVLGVARYCNKFLEAPKLPAMSTLMNTFGDPLPCIERRIQLGGLKVVQVDLIDATCWRNNACPPGVPRPYNLKVIRNRSAKVNALAVAYPDVEFWISPALEQDVKDVNTVKAMLKAAQDGCPSCRIINSPFTGAKPAGYPVELHGTTVTGFSVSADGKSCFDADTLNGDGNDFNFCTSGKYTTFSWAPEFNGRTSGEDRFIPSLQRTCWPTADLFTQAYLTMQPQQPIPAAPAQCEMIYTVKAPEIFKPNAEAYSPCPHPDKRGNRPLLIINRAGNSGDQLPVINRDGDRVGCFKYYGRYSSGSTHRWYLGNCSGQTPAELYKDFKGEWGFVKLGKNKCLLINSIRRLGSYR